MINIIFFNGLCLIIINYDWSDHERFPAQIIPYNIGHILCLSTCFICLIIILIKLCWYKNKEVVSLKNHPKLSSLIEFIILFQNKSILFFGARINTIDLSYQNDNYKKGEIIDKNVLFSISGMILAYIMITAPLKFFLKTNLGIPHG